MWILVFYRILVAVTAGGIAYFFVSQSVFLWIITTIAVRLCWFAAETAINHYLTDRHFAQHIQPFKQLLGPYGIRLVNRAEKDYRIRASLAEVFTPNTKKVRKTVEQLEVMDTLFRAGMRPQGDEYLLHDLKLKYGKMRIENEG